MGKTIIGEDAFPEIIQQYNSGGRTSAYDFLRSRYGIKHPYFVMNRIRECGQYTYDPDTDRFAETVTSAADGVFMDLDELCGTAMITCIWRSKKERRPPRKGELCRRRREYQPPEMGIHDAPAGG